MSSHSFLVADVTEAHWLAEREKGIGASEAAAAMGVSRYCSPLELYQRKTGLLPPVAENEAMRWGRRLEPLIALAWEETSGEAIATEQLFTRSPLLPCLSATIDGLSSRGEILEYKTIGAFRERDELGEDASDEIPVEWQIQAHAQMIAADGLLEDGYTVDAGHVRFPVLVGGQHLRQFVVDRDSNLIARVSRDVEAFAKRLMKKEPPAPGPRDAGLIANLFPKKDAGGEVEFSFDLAAVADAFVLNGEEARGLQSQREVLKARLMMAMGNATVAVLPDGRRLKRILREMPGGTYTRNPYTSVELRFAK